MQTKKGFTLIELLVVIAIIALLLSIVMPALKMVKEKGRQVVCASGLKGVGVGVSAYLSENDYTFHEGKNYGLWENIDGLDGSVPDGDPLPYDSGRAYWGVAYAEYTSGKDVFECPSVRVGDVDFWYAPGEYFNGRPVSELKEYFRYCGYGLNKYTNSRGSTIRKSTNFKLPAKVIFAQDHIEQLMDATDASNYWDLLSVSPNGHPRLSQWVNVYQGPLYPNVTGACFRHSRKSNGNEGYSNTLWLDGHAEPIRETDDVPFSWYSGG